MNMSQSFDLDACRRLLNEISELCEHASLTGSFASGNRRTAERYNMVLSNLEKLEIVSPGMFAPFQGDPSFDEIGVEARMLAAYCGKSNHRSRDRGDDGSTSLLMRLAPFVRQEELGQLIRDQRRNGADLDMNTIANLAPFLDQDILSELLKEQMTAGAKSGGPSAPATPVAPDAPGAVSVSLVSVSGTSEFNEIVPVRADSDSLDDLLNLLKSQYLSDAERDVIVEKVRNFHR